MKSLRCKIGFHRWRNHGGDWADSRDYRCDRCGERAPRCKNCGGQHSPTAFTVCTVTRYR